MSLSFQVVELAMAVSNTRNMNEKTKKESRCCKKAKSHNPFVHVKIKTIGPESSQSWFVLKGKENYCIGFNTKLF